MSPRAPQSKTTTNTFKSFRSPPPKKQPVDEDTPPVPPPPPPPLVIPGPNAFAQQKRVASDERRAFEARSGLSGSPTQTYTVKDYRDLDASSISPTIRRNKMRANRVHYRANSSTDKNQSVLSTPSSAAIESATWSDLAASFESPAAFLKQQQSATSKFYQSMRLARDQLDENDGDNEKHQQHDSQSSFAASEKLKLTPSPDPNVFEHPTHRAALDEKTQDRFRELIQNNGTVSHGVQIANVHESTPEPQKSNNPDTPLNKTSAKTDKSPKKGGFFNKLGLGLKMTGQDEHQSTITRHPSIRNVPPKAAKVLGAQSLPTRNWHEASTRARAWDDVSPDSNSPVVDSPGRSLSATSPKKSNSPSKAMALSSLAAEDHHMPQPNESQPPKSPLRRESRRIARRTQLRQYDEDSPPTPPSKPRPGKETDADTQEGVSTQAGEPEKSKYVTARNTVMQRSLLPTGSHRAGYAGHHASAQIGISPAISSMYGSFRISPDPSPTSQLPQDYSPQRVSQMLRATKNGALPPTRYDPTSPQAKWSFSHLPPSMESLRPGPLHLPEHKRSHSSNALHPQKSLSNNCSEKSRNASESTSMSVPVFIDGQDRSMSAAGISNDIRRGVLEGHEHSDAGSSTNAALTTELLHEYLVETWNQNEAIKESMHVQNKTLQALEMHINSHNEDLITQLENQGETQNQHYSTVHEIITKTTASEQKHEVATAANATALAQLQLQTSTLTSTMQDIQRHFQTLSTTHSPLPPVPTDTSTTASPTSPLTPTTADFAPQVTNPSQNAHTYSPYASSTRAGTPSPHRRSPNKTQATRRLDVQPQSQPIQRIDTIPLFGSSPMRSPGSRADMQTHPSMQTRAGAAERESTVSNTSTSTDRTSGPRGYLQSVPQSAMTDPGVSGQTWGRKVAMEKASRWTG